MSFELFNPVTNNWVTMFVIGALTTFPSMAPTALALKEKKNYKLYRRADLESKLLYVPIVYGIMSIIFFYLFNSYIPQEYNNYFVLGFLFALVYPTLGTVTGYAKEIYGTKSIPKLYLGAQVMYIIWYGLIMNLMVQNICS